VRTNFWDNEPQLCQAPDGPQKYDPNTFGTAEFMRFCQLSGAKPYLAANVRSLTPHDFDEWVEYCNSPEGSTTLAQTRASDGSRDPYNVIYWGIGNESWGCGGDFRPEEYAVEFRRFTSWVPSYGQELRLIGSGPGAGHRDPQVSWTRGFLDNLVSTGSQLLDRLYGLSMHYYCGTTGKGDSLEYTVDDWYEMLLQADFMDSLVSQHWTAMGEYDKSHKVKMVVDEWGAWHRTAALGPTFLFNYVPSLRDALVSAITLDIFNRHAEKLAMQPQYALPGHGRPFRSDYDFPRLRRVQIAPGRTLVTIGLRRSRDFLWSREDALGTCRIGVLAREIAGGHCREPSHN
jgi:alpha-N-arabinofuranosidase